MRQTPYPYELRPRGGRGGLLGNPVCSDDVHRSIVMRMKVRADDGGTSSPVIARWLIVRVEQVSCQRANDVSFSSS